MIWLAWRQARAQIAVALVATAAVAQNPPTRIRWASVAAIDPRHHHNLADYALSSRNDNRDHRGRTPNHPSPLIRRGS